VQEIRPRSVDPPDWATQPCLEIDSLTAAEFATIQRHRALLLKIVHREVENYLNDPLLCPEGGSFPDRLRLTGEYYIGAESYTAHREPDWFQISVMCRCLEHPKAGVPREDDYLGLEVWLKCVPGRWARFEVFRNTDSSTI
jgi:hypothetical protein